MNTHRINIIFATHDTPLVDLDYLRFSIVVYTTFKKLQFQFLKDFTAGIFTALLNRHGIHSAWNLPGKNRHAQDSHTGRCFCC